MSISGLVYYIDTHFTFMLNMFSSKLKLLTSLIPKCQSFISQPGIRCITTLQKPLTLSKPTFPLQGSPAAKSFFGSSLLQATLSVFRDSVRTHIKCHYRPNALKRIRKHGLEKRLSKSSQRKVLFRRIIKGRHVLAVFDRFLNQVPELPVKGKKRVNLFDPKKGYRSVLKKPEYFRFE